MTCAAHRPHSPAATGVPLAQWRSQFFLHKRRNVFRMQVGHPCRNLGMNRQQLRAKRFWSRHDGVAVLPAVVQPTGMGPRCAGGRPNGQQGKLHCTAGGHRDGCTHPCHEPAPGPVPCRGPLSPCSTTCPKPQKTLAASSLLRPRPRPKTFRRCRAAPPRPATARAAAAALPARARLRLRLLPLLLGQTPCWRRLRLSVRLWSSCGTMCRPSCPPSG